jgi:hypothetical protein
MNWQAFTVVEIKAALKKRTIVGHCGERKPELLFSILPSRILSLIMILSNRREYSNGAHVSAVAIVYTLQSLDFVSPSTRWLLGLYALSLLERI